VIATALPSLSIRVLAQAVGAERDHLDPLAMAERYTAQFMVDRRKLNIMDPQVVARATRHVPEMIALIEQLIANGHAYVAPDGVYYDTKTFPGYGHAAQSRATRSAGGRRARRGEPEQAEPVRLRAVARGEAR